MVTVQSLTYSLTPSLWFPLFFTLNLVSARANPSRSSSYGWGGGVGGVQGSGGGGGVVGGGVMRPFAP